MTAATCVTGCGQPTQDVMRLCRGCIGTLEAVLRSVGTVMARAEVTLGRRSVMGAHNDGGRSAETAIPLHTGMYEAKLTFETQMVGWTRDLAERHGEKQLPGPDMASVAAWLLDRIWRIATHDAAGDIYDELTSSLAHIERLIDRPPDRELVGLCEVDDCRGWLYAVDGAAGVTCQNCGVVYPVADSRERLRERLAGMLMTQREIADMAVVFGISRRRAMKLMASWAERGRIIPGGHTPDGQPRYQFGATLQMLRDTPTRARRAS